MPVITLTLSWHLQALPSYQPGWRIGICGGSRIDIDMSFYKFIRGGTAPFRRTENSGHQGIGPVGWLLTPDQDHTLGVNTGGASLDNPPMGLVTLFLEALEEKGWHVVASHSTSGGPKHGFSASFMWTFKHIPIK